MEDEMKKGEGANLQGLPKLEGFDLDSAMEILQSEEVVQMILVEFDDFLEQLCPKLTALYSDNMHEDAIHNYRIEVHALKSSAATVGAKSLSELARTQELAAIDRDMKRISELHPVLLEQIDKTKSVLHKYVQECRGRI